MNLHTALYRGIVRHHRLRPRPHKLRYRVFWMLLDVDRIGETADRLRLFSHNRFNVMSLYDRDHGDGSATSLRDQINDHLRNAGIEAAGPTYLLCMPRILGYGFNPLSVYFCHARDGALAAIVYEVHNTFGERHSYLIPAARSREIVDQHCEKEFYVSPFLDMDMRYQFRVTLRRELLSVAIAGSDKNGPLIHASLSGQPGPLTDFALLRALVRYPLLTLKVIAAIHWHALKMLLKGYRIRSRPAPPPALYSYVSNRKSIS